MIESMAAKIAAIADVVRNPSDARSTELVEGWNSENCKQPTDNPLMIEAKSVNCEKKLQTLRNRSPLRGVSGSWTFGIY